MNSGRSHNGQEQPFGNWLEKARLRWRGAIVHGSGQFAVCVMNHKDIYLFPTFESAAELTSQDTKYRQHDLSQYRDFLDKMPDPYDPEEVRRERREERERRAKLQPNQ